MFNKCSSQCLFTFFIITISICSFNALGQEISTRIHGEKMKSYLDLEKKLGSKLYQDEGDIIIPGGMAMPLTYRRAERDIPDLLVTYTFSIKDSLIDRINYEWDVVNFKPGQKIQPLEVQKALINKYLSLVEQLNRKIGKGKQKGDLSDLTKINSRDGLVRSDEWKPNDTTYVNMYSVFGNYQEETGNVKTKPVSRIILGISKMKKPAPELNDKAVAAAMQSYDQFINKLRAGDQAGAKALLSTQIRGQLTEIAFNNLKAAIKLGDFKIYNQTLQSIAGTNYLVIQYVYANAPEQPKEVIKVIFDKEHFIIGIQPLVFREKQ